MNANNTKSGFLDELTGFGYPEDSDPLLIKFPTLSAEAD